MTHLVIENQSSNIEIVSAAIIQKVYEMALSAEGDVSLKGNLQSDHAKQTAYDYLTGNLTGTSTKRFPQLSLNVTGGIYIDFQDSLVEQILLSKNLGDGVGVTQSDLYAINTLEGSWFSGSNITSFNELQYFKPSAVSQQGGFQNCNYLTEVTLPAGITFINTNLFKSCDVLETINNTQSITQVMQGGLAECPNLESLNLQSLTTVGQYAFQQDTNLQSIGTGAPTTIGEHAFENCSSLTSINLSNCTTINDFTFKGCTSLSNINLSNIRQISTSAFEGCTSLAIEVELTLTQNALGSNIFKSCPITKLVIHDQNLTNINVTGSGNNQITQELPNVTYIDLSDTNIQGATFRNDKQLVTAITPANNSTLYAYNFVENCENLQYIIITNTSQVVIPVNETLKYMFKGKHAPNANIYVPDTLLSQYQSSSSWSDATYAPTFATTRIKGHSELPSNITWATKTSS